MSTGLFQDEEDGYNLEEETKYKLKLNNPSSDVDSEDDFDLGDDEEFDLDMGGDEGGLDLGDEGGSEKPFDDEPFDAGVEADEESEPETYIQQLSGKLGQSLRKYTDDSGAPDYDLEKFAINSVISATHTADMDPEDQKDIIQKIKSSGKDDEESLENLDEPSDEEPKDNAEPEVDGGEELDLGDESLDEGLSDEGIKYWATYGKIGEKINAINDIDALADAFRYMYGKLEDESAKDALIYFFNAKKEQLAGEAGVEFPNHIQESEKPVVTPKEKEIVQPKPDIRRTTFNPTKKPSPKPKMISEEHAEQQVVNVEKLNEKAAYITVHLGGEDILMKFVNTNEIIERPNDYDEPWIFAYDSVDAPDGKEYVVGVEFYGHPDTHLDIADVADSRIEIK